jgi:predicted esterase
MHEKIIKIRVLSHSTTGLLMAMSDDMPGLVVHGRSDEDLERKLPAALRELLEASGFTVVDVTLMRDESAAMHNFGPPAFIANASLSAGQH